MNDMVLTGTLGNQHKIGKKKEKETANLLRVVVPFLARLFITKS